MTEALITDSSVFSASELKIADCKTTNKGGKSCKILDKHGNPLVIATPSMLTWGINTNVDEQTGNSSYKLVLQFPSSANDGDVANLLEQLKQLEELVIKTAVANPRDWFNKTKMSEDVARELFNPTLKYPKDKTTKETDYSRAPTFQVKLPFYENKFNCELYDENETLLFAPKGFSKTPAELVPKGSRIAAIVQCNGVYVISGKFGISWSFVQGVVSPPLRIEGKCFLRTNKVKAANAKATDDLSGYDQPHDDDVVADVKKLSLASKSATVVEDSDDEAVAARIESDDEDEAPVVVAKPAPKPEPVETDDEEEAPAPVAKPVAKAAPKKVVKKVTKA